MSFLSARTKVGLTQAKVAKEMQVSDAAVSMWETGKTRPRASLLIKLAGLYCCSVDELLSGNPSTVHDETSQRMSKVTAAEEEAMAWPL